MNRREFLAASFAAGAVAHAGAVTEAAHAFNNQPTTYSAMTGRGMLVCDSLELVLVEVRKGVQIFDLYEGPITIGPAGWFDSGRPETWGNLSRGRQIDGFTA